MQSVQHICSVLVWFKCRCIVMLTLLYCFLKVRIMKKRLVKKAFDMILGISLSENREVCIRTLDPFYLYLSPFFVPLLITAMFW